jgi:hypothetical protein
MHLKQIAFVCRSAEIVGSAIWPYIGSVPTVLSELDVISVRSTWRLEDKYQFMLATIKRTHSSIVFGPDTYVF